MKIDIALLVIDVQNGMFQETDPVYDGHGLLERISGIIKKARACDTPVIMSNIMKVKVNLWKPIVQVGTYTP